MFKTKSRSLLNCCEASPPLDVPLFKVHFKRECKKSMVIITMHMESFTSQTIANTQRKENLYGF